MRINTHNWLTFYAFEISLYLLRLIFCNKIQNALDLRAILNLVI
jgi:hypothetical protein